MTRCLLLALSLPTLSLVGQSPALPAPAPKPRPKGAEALLYIKRVPGRTDKEQGEIRQKVRYLLIFGLREWILEPDTRIPGLEGPFSTPKRLKWRNENVQLTWVEDTGVLRITCQAGTPREQAIFVNKAVEHAIAFYEQEKKGRKEQLASKERSLRRLRPSDDPKSKKMVADCLKDISTLQKIITDLSEIVVLDLAEVPPK